MTIAEFEPVPALVGGLLIGGATGLALVLNGKIAGVSGVVARIFRRVSGDTAWRVAFVVGLVVGGAASFVLYPPSASFERAASLPVMAVAGLLVGLGARVGGGCTSGHGVCGISRGSTPGILGTVTFMGVAFLTVFVIHHLVAGGAS